MQTSVSGSATRRRTGNSCCDFRPRLRPGRGLNTSWADAQIATGAAPIWHIPSDSCRSFRTVLSTSMLKRLQTVGNSSGVIIDKPILELLRITPETELDISTDGERLIITPLRSDAARKRKLARAQERTVAAHERTFRKLAK